MIDAYLDECGFAVDEGLSGGLTVMAASALEDALAGLAQWRPVSGRRPRVRLWLSGRLCRPFLVDGLGAMRDPREHLRVATAVAPGATGLAEPGRVWLDAVRAGEPTPAAVVDARTWALLDTALRRRELAVAGLGPWWSAVLRFALARDAALDGLAVREESTVTILLGQDARFSAARTFSLVADDEAARAMLLRAAMAQGSAVRAGATLGLDLFSRQRASQDVPPQPSAPGLLRWAAWHEEDA